MTPCFRLLSDPRAAIFISFFPPVEGARWSHCSLALLAGPSPQLSPGGERPGQSRSRKTLPFPCAFFGASRFRGRRRRWRLFGTRRVRCSISTRARARERGDEERETNRQRKERGQVSEEKRERAFFVQAEGKRFFKMSCNPSISLGEGKPPPQRDTAFSLQAGECTAEEKAVAIGARRRKRDRKQFHMTILLFYPRQWNDAHVRTRLAAHVPCPPKDPSPSR